jgi:long-subunit fatty acid transport protein
MTTIRACRFVLLLTVASLGLAAAAGAQTNDEVFPQVQWNFSTPGARANGMGRTFIGTADDASAAVTNPAGLMNLTRPQV